MQDNTMQGNASNPVPQLSARIDRLVNKEGSMLRAVASVTISNHFVIRGVCVVDGKNGLFVQMPRDKYNKDGQTMYADRFFPISAEARSALNNCVLDTYESYLREIQEQYLRSMAAAAASGADSAEQNQPYPDSAEQDQPYPDSAELGEDGPDWPF